MQVAEAAALAAQETHGEREWGAGTACEIFCEHTTKYSYNSIILSKHQDSFQIIE